MDNKNNGNDLLEKFDLRKQMMGKIDILDTVKDIVTLPHTKLMNTKMVAEWYEVQEVTVKQVYNRNKTELTENGVKTVRGTELQQLKSEIQDVTLLGKANAVTIYSKRALLNVGMLLADSHVAKRLRTALLDHQEVITDEQKVLHINEEKELALAIMFADTEEDKMMAFGTYRQYKNRHIEELETTIQEQTPKVESFDTFMDGSNFKKMNDVAKSLGYGRNKLYVFLRGKKVLMRDNLPYQKYIDNGYFTVKETPIQQVGFSKNHSQTYVSAKGMNYISKLLRQEGLI